MGGVLTLDPSDISALRRMFSQMLEQKLALTGPPDYTGVKKSVVQVPVVDGSSIRSVLYQPESSPASGSALVVLYHGGGYCIGAPETEEPIALEVVQKHGAVALSVGYRMAPEYVFPTAITDSFDALKWAAKNAASLGADPLKGFVIGGTSAGGVIANVLSHLARDEKLSPPLTAVWLNVPAVVSQSVLPEKYREEHTSYQQNANAPILDVKALENFFSMCLFGPYN